MNSQHTSMIGTDIEIPPCFEIHNAQDIEGAVQGVGLKDKPFFNQALQLKMHLDGASIELAGMMPAPDPDALVRQVTAWIDFLRNTVPLQLVPADYVYMYDLVNFSEDTCPRYYESCNTFGCSPDWIRGKQRTVPCRTKESPVREAGVHFHGDLPPRYINNHRSLAAIAATVRQALQEYESPRRTPAGEMLWYRVPGLYRPTNYGIEYRSLGGGLLADMDRFHQAAQIFTGVMNEAWNASQTAIAS